MFRLHQIIQLVRSSQQPYLGRLSFGKVDFRLNKLSVRLYSATKKKKPTSTIDRLRRSTNTLESEQKILQLINKSNDPTIELSRYLKPVTSITLSDSINFQILGEILKLQKLSFQEIVPEEVIKVNYEQKDLLILSNGTIIGWDFTEKQLSLVVSVFESAINEKYDYESDEFDYIELDEMPDNPRNNGNSYMINEIIVIQNINSHKKDLDKSAFSIGLSRSTRLSILENNLEEFLKLTKENSQNLANGSKINITEHEILKLTGKLFLLRGKLNLYSELIDTPDLYWSEPTLEKIYQQVSTALDINSRISILNRKLDYTTEEQRTLLSVLNEKKGTRLEWIIIVLIMVEVGFETYRVVYND